MTFQGCTRLELVEENEEIEARLREFQSHLGVRVTQVFPMEQNGVRVALIAFVIAPSQALFDWFLDIVEGYDGVLSCQPFPGST